MLNGWNMQKWVLLAFQFEFWRILSNSFFENFLAKQRIFYRFEGETEIDLWHFLGILLDIELAAPNLFSVIVRFAIPMSIVMDK